MQDIWFNVEFFDVVEDALLAVNSTTVGRGGGATHCLQFGAQSQALCTWVDMMLCLSLSASVQMRKIRVFCYVSRLCHMYLATVQPGCMRVRVCVCVAR